MQMSCLRSQSDASPAAECGHFSCWWERSSWALRAPGTLGHTRIPGSRAYTRGFGSLTQPINRNKTLPFLMRSLSSTCGNPRRPGRGLGRTGWSTHGTAPSSPGPGRPVLFEDCEQAPPPSPYLPELIWQFLLEEKKEELSVCVPFASAVHGPEDTGQ